MSTVDFEEPRYGASLGKNWWLFLITGTLWLCLSLVVFRFDISSAKSIGILAGIVFLIAGAFELLLLMVVEGGWWKLLNGLLGVVFVVGGIMSFIHPGNAFVAVASITGFMFLFVGIMEVIVAFATKDSDSIWWLRLTMGIAAILLAFWASGDFERKAILLVAWVGAFCLLRGFNSFFLAFALRKAHRELAG
jgi:uncharacterized membrane protein HdeD (DUF308 family)